jgi:hypothetical protein
MAHLLINAGYSVLTAFNFNPPVYFDDKTGNIFFTPTNPDITIFAILVQDFRNGILMGEVTREFEHFVASGNSTPSISGNSINQTYSLSICEGIPTCFAINSNDSDVSDTTHLRLLTGIPNSSFTIIRDIEKRVVSAGHLLYLM